MVPHSHDDVGWLKTVDQYYYGEKNNVHRAGVQYIIDSVIRELALDPKKRFIQVETAFFWKWWTDQNEDMKDMVKEMVNQGRLEFIGGGWSMHDEATVHYSALIDNMSFGMRQLKSWFGKLYTSVRTFLSTVFSFLTLEWTTKELLIINMLQILCTL